MSVQTEERLQAQPEAPVETEVQPTPEPAPVPEPAPEPVPVQPPTPKKKKKRHIKKIITAVVALVLVALIVLYVLPLLGSTQAATGPSFVEHTVALRDITVSISGSSALQPADSYTVTSLVAAEILSDTFEEGDIVSKDSLLYEIDSSDLQSEIRRSENSLALSRKTHAQKVEGLQDLNITASASGTIIELRVEEVDDKVNANQVVAVIRDVDTLRLTLPFVVDDAALLREGMSAVVTIDGTFEEISGTVSKIGAIDELLNGSLPVRQVTIDIQNPGGLSLARSASAMVGEFACSGPGTFTYKDEVQVTASASGKVASILTKEGDKVRKGETLIRLQSNSLENDIESSTNQLDNAEIALQNQYDRLENYSITSPISGTIIDKHYKAGDNAETGRALCTIYDLSYLTMTLNVDELDISKVKVGQEVSITTDAVSGKMYAGVVTKVSVAGMTSGGVTTYPVTIRIDETEGLLPGMNASAEIFVMDRQNVAAVPVSAVARGNRILVRTGDAPAAEGGETAQQGAFQPREAGGQPIEGSQIIGGRPIEGGQMPEGFDPNNPPEGMTRPEGGMVMTQETLLPAGANGLPDGYEYRDVVLGESDGEFIEVLEGLVEGDVIAYAQAVASTLMDAYRNMAFGGGGGTVTVVESAQPIGGGQGPGGGRQ